MALSNATLWPFKRVPGHRMGNIGEPKKEIEVEPLEEPIEEPVPEKVPIKREPK